MRDASGTLGSGVLDTPLNYILFSEATSLWDESWRASNEFVSVIAGAPELARMKKGSYLMNASRGTVVDIPALAHAVKSGHLAGAAIDVFPEEPETNSDGFKTDLRGLANVILTPHIGGSTMEAQEAIGREVATALSKYLDGGSTVGSVNFPPVELPRATRTGSATSGSSDNASDSVSWRPASSGSISRATRPRPRPVARRAETPAADRQGASAPPPTACALVQRVLQRGQAWRVSLALRMEHDFWQTMPSA